MFDYYKYVKPLLFALPAEFAHNLAIFALKNQLLPYQTKYNNKKLETTVAGIKFRNPIGLAAGFDKNADCLPSLLRQNFGFLEVGTTTPVPQKGNVKPRLFRFSKDEAIINRMGFNNSGVELFSQRLRQWKYGHFYSNQIVIGANIGKNKNSPNDASDYLYCLDKLCGLCDYITINISSPNTPGLREMQKKEILENLVTEVSDKWCEIMQKYPTIPPIFVKISPDESDETLGNIAEIALNGKIHGVIISNTSVRKDIVINKTFADKHAQGGLSGKPIFELSTEIVRKFYKLTSGKVPIIGVGGISDAKSAYQKIRAGASLIQIYTALIYKGFSLVNEINHGLVELLEEDGFNHISEAVGVDVK